MLFVDIISCRFSFVIWSFFQIPYLMQLKKVKRKEWSLLNLRSIERHFWTLNQCVRTLSKVNGEMYFSANDGQHTPSRTFPLCFSKFLEKIYFRTRCTAIFNYRWKRNFKVKPQLGHEHDFRKKRFCVK